MALFSKEPETNSRPEHSHEPSQSLAAIEIQPLAGENVAPARDAASALREAGVAPRKGVDARAYLSNFAWASADIWLISSRSVLALASSK